MRRPTRSATGVPTRRSPTGPTDEENVCVRYPYVLLVDGFCTSTYYGDGGGGSFYNCRYAQ